MAKFAVAVVVLVQLMGLSHASLIGDLLPITVGLTQDLQSITIIPGNNIGLIALPLNALCGTPIVDTYITCFICNQDCIYVHNGFGGRCAPNPNNSTYSTCLCAYTEEDAEDRDISLSSRDTCKAILPSLLGAVDDTAFRTVLVTRMNLLQCPQYSNGTYQSSGCATDCTANHGDKGGSCAVTAPRDSDVGTDPTLHCECNY